MMSSNLGPYGKAPAMPGAPVSPYGFAPQPSPPGPKAPMGFGAPVSPAMGAYGMQPHLGPFGYGPGGTPAGGPTSPAAAQPIFPPTGGPTPSFPSAPGAGAQQGVQVPGQLPAEESYIENILRLNLGKIATIYMTFENNTQWNAKVFKGRLEAAGRDHIIISDPQTGMRYLLLMVNLDYITFDQELNYTYPYAAGR